MSYTDKNTIAVLGMFDGMHIGHRAVLENARRIKMMTGLPIAVFTFMGSAMLPKYGGRRDVLLMNDEDKLAELRAQGAEVITRAGSDIFGYTPEQFFNYLIKEKFGAKHVVCGYDFRFGKERAGDIHTLRELCGANGMELSTVPTTRGGDPYLPISSTRIRDLVRKGETEKAAELLGHEMYYTLPVVSGKQLGRTIGFPTMNQQIPDFMVRPKYGVYAARAVIDGTEYPAMTDIGVKPTVKSDGEEIMETHIIGFEGDLYGRTVRVYLRRFIRGERKFESLDELRLQLENDRNECSHI